MLSTVLVASILACVSAIVYKGNVGAYGPQGNRFVGYGPLNSKGYYRGMGGFGNQLDMFNGGYQKGGMIGGYKKGSIFDGGYPKGGMKGYKKGGMFDGGLMGGYQKGGMVGGGYPTSGIIGGFSNGGMFGGYPKGGKGMMESIYYPGFNGLNSYSSGFGMEFQGLGGYPKFGNGGFGQGLGGYPKFGNGGFGQGLGGYSKFGNGGFGQMGGAHGIKGFNKQSGFKKGGY